MRGRKDEVSNVFLSFAIDRLCHLLHPFDDLDKSFRSLKDHHASKHLDASVIRSFKLRHGMKGTANSVNHEAFDTEIAAHNPVVKLLTTECEVTVTWPSEYRKTARLSNEKDLMMVMDALDLVCQPGRENIYVYLLEQINAGHAKSAFKTLDQLTAVGDKLASMTIRDICMMNPDLAAENVSNTFPVDTWVRQVAVMLGCKAQNDSEIKAFFQERCSECDIDVSLFAAGMWYLGANALKVLVDDFLGNHELTS